VINSSRDTERDGRILNFIRQGNGP